MLPALALAGTVLLFLAWKSAWRDMLRSGVRRAAVVRALGDVDRDGCTDFVLGSAARERVWVISGRRGVVLQTIGGGGASGIEVAAAGDADGDGASDVWIALPEDGRVVLCSSASGKEL